MNRDVEIVQEMLDMGQFVPEAMKEVLLHYQDHPAIVPCKILEGSKIIRSSTNDAYLFHENVARLSYPPVEFARTDRASLKGKPMFYGTVFTSAVEHNAYPRIFSAMETTDILRSFEKEGRVFITQSLWLPDRDIHLFAFPFSKNYKRACDEVRFQREAWDHQLSKHWPKQYCEFSEYLGDLIAKENHSCLYDITANTIDYILYHSTAARNLDGVMYPSVWGDGEGMNICLKKETVDECVHFQAASVQYIDKIVGKSTIFGVAESYLMPDGTLKWTPTKEALTILEKTYGVKAMFERNMIYFDVQNNKNI